MATDSLTNNKISTTYGGVLHLQGTPISTNSTAALQYVYDGLGTKSGLQIGKDGRGISVSGAITTNGKLESTGVVSSGEVIGTLGSGYGQARYVGGQYGVIQRNDGSNFYTLITSDGDPYGGWSTKRPFVINLATGFVTMYTQLNVIVPGGGGARKPDGWGGGVTTFDVYSDGGSIGAGPQGTGQIAAVMNRDGYIEGDIIKARTKFIGMQIPKAWVRFFGHIGSNGSWLGERPSNQGYTLLQGSYNVKGVWRYGPGNYRVEFNTPMPNLNYMVIGSGTQPDQNGGNVSVAEYWSSWRGSATNPVESDNKTAWSVQLEVLDTDVGNRGAIDGVVSLVIFGDDTPLIPVDNNLTGSVVTTCETESRYANSDNGTITVTVNLAKATLDQGSYVIRASIGTATSSQYIAAGNKQAVFKFTGLSNGNYQVTVSDQRSGFGKVAVNQAEVTYNGANKNYNF